MSQIFRFPAGLLGFLGTKAVGQNPAQLGALVAPSLDLREFYRAGFVRSVAGNTFGPLAIAVGSQQLVATVPQGKVWIPWAFIVDTYGTGAGDQGTVVPVISDAQGRILYANGAQQVTAVNGTAMTRAVLDMTDRILLFPSGTQFLIEVQRIVVSTAGIDGGWSLSYIELEA